MPDPTMAAPEACIVGWAHTPFGRSEAPDIETLLAQVGRAAIEDAGISPADIDAGFVGVFGEGFTNQGFPSSLILQSVPELRFKPITRYENACATGTAAIHGALDFLAAEARPLRPRPGRREDDRDPRRAGRRDPAQRQLPQDRAGHPGRFRRRLRPHRRGLFPAPRRPVRRARRHRREESQEWRRQPLGADAQGPRLRLLPRREREEPLRRPAAEAHRLFAW